MEDSGKYTGLVVPVFDDLNLLKNQSYLENNSIRYKIILEAGYAFLMEIDVFDVLSRGISVSSLVNILMNVNTEDQFYKKLLENDFDYLLNPGIYISGFSDKNIHFWDDNQLVDKLVNIRNFYYSKALKFTIGVENKSLIKNYPSYIGKSILSCGSDDENNIDELIRFVRSTKNITSEFILDILFDLVSGVFRESERLESAIINTIYNYSKNSY